MRWTIAKQIFLAVTLASIVIVAISAAATRYSFDRSFSGYLEEQDDIRLAPIVAQLVALHTDGSGWLGLRQEPDRWRTLFRDEYLKRDRRPPPPGDRRPPPKQTAGHSEGMDLHDRVALIDANGDHVIGPPLRGVGQQIRQVPINYDGQQLGLLLVARRSGLTEEVDIRFAKAQDRATQLIGLLVLLVAAAIAAFLARQLTKPVRRLATATRELASGNFETRITVARDDELGDLARDFNALALSLQRSRDSRRQWVADVAHELRTPLSILSGELQAIEDGVRAFNDSTVRSLQGEVDRLGKLVSDMHILTSSDEGKLILNTEPIEIYALLRDALENSSARLDDACLDLNIMLPDRKAIVDGDPARLHQLVTNLIENSIRYTDSPGSIRVSATDNLRFVTVAIADSTPGVSDSDLPRLFDRLFRVDGSRNRSTGGSGLGLAICSAIVEAHGGKISAHHADIGGVEIVIQLPLAEDASAL